MSHLSSTKWFLSLQFTQQYENILVVLDYHLKERHNVSLWKKHGLTNLIQAIVKRNCCTFISPHNCQNMIWLNKKRYCSLQKRMLELPDNVKNKFQLFCCFFFLKKLCAINNVFSRLTIPCSLNVLNNSMAGEKLLTRFWAAQTTIYSRTSVTLHHWGAKVRFSHNSQLFSSMRWTPIFYPYKRVVIIFDGVIFHQPCLEKTVQKC